MESKNSTIMLIILLIVSWFIFVGLGIQAGGFIVGAVFALAKPEVVKNLWMWQEVNLSALYSYSYTSFFIIAVVMSIVAVLKAILFYLIIHLLQGKKLNLSQPFNNTMGKFIFRMSYLSLFIGFASIAGAGYSEFLVEEGVQMPDIQYMHMGGSDVWIFMGIALLVIAHIFKKGIEIQEEHELTV